MYRERTSTLTVVSIVLDVLLAGAAFFVAYHVKIRLPGDLASLGRISEYGWLLLIYLVALLASNYLHGFYTFGRTLTNGEILTLTARSTTIVMLCIMVVLFAFKIQSISRLFVVMFGVVHFALAMLAKLAMKHITGRMQSQGFNTVNALIIGTGPLARRMIASIASRPELGYRLIGCVDVDPALVGTDVEGIRVIGLASDLENILLREQVDEVFFAMPAHLIGNLPRIIWACEEIGIRFSLMADFLQTSIAKAGVRYFLDVPLLTFSTTPSQVGQLIIKAVLDRVLTAVGIVVLAPVFAAIAIAIKLDSPGPVLFRQVRSGLNGRRFTMYKFRTMVENAEQLQEELRRFNEMSGPVFKMTRDPRVTRVGRWLRRTSMDELPQLVNVLMGDMSLVGPRPPIPEEVERYERWQRRRLSMRPGLTCYWQISGRNEVNFAEWMEMDLMYIDNWSLKLDFIILGKTIPAVISGRGAR